MWQKKTTAFQEQQQNQYSLYQHQQKQKAKFASFLVHVAKSMISGEFIWR